MLSTKTFRIPRLVITGQGTSVQAAEEIKKLNIRKVLVVTDRNLVKLGLLDGITQALRQQNIPFGIFDGVVTEPTTEFVDDGLKALRGNSCDSLLAVGGGSVIDTAKAIAVMATNEGSIADYRGIGKIPLTGRPIIAVPTTAGTGSEVTPFTIITDASKNLKMLIGSPFAMPEIAIVDSSLTVSMPQNITAATGIDALTHAIEAYVSRKAQPLTDVFCLSAIRLISGNLRRAWADRNDIEARENTMFGALQAGMAFGNSSVALVHGMARPIGAYFHVAHGASNAALLSVVMEFSLIGNPARYAQIAQAMGVDTSGLTEMEASRAGVAAVRQLIKDIKVPTLRDLGVDKRRLTELIPQMAEDAITSGSPGNNPRQATKEEIGELYKIAYES